LARWSEQGNLELIGSRDRYIQSRIENGVLIRHQERDKTAQLVIGATFVAEPIAPYVEWWCKQFQLPIDIQFAPYNQLFQQLLDPESLLSENKGINVLFIRFEDWIRDLHYASEEEYINHIEKNYLDLTTILTSRSNNTPVFIGVFPGDCDIIRSELI